MAHWNPFLLLPLLLLLSGCATITHFSHEKAAGYQQLEREECVPYARRVSGINIRGNAYTWWDQAAGKYARGHQPASGAVLVLARTNKLRYGHVAVVSRVMGPREIDVTHTNWGSGFMSRRMVYESQRVEDVSTANNWTLVRFWNDEHNVFGFPYPALGFIYSQRPSY